MCLCCVCVSVMQLESGLDHLARAQGMDSVLDLYQAHAHGIMQTIKVTHTLTTHSVSHYNFPLTYSNPLCQSFPNSLTETHLRSEAMTVVGENRSTAGYTKRH